MFSIPSRLSSREIIFSDRQGDEFIAELRGNPSASIRVDAYTDSQGLATYFKELASHDKPWSGEVRWASLEEEFIISATCSSLGEVHFIITFHQYLGSPEEWSISAGIETELGQLPMIAKQVSRFFSNDST